MTRISDTTDPVALVVGAGPGIGAAVAARFATAGYAVGLIARDEQRLVRLAAGLDTRTAVATADATVPEELTDAIAAVRAELGPPEALCFSPIPDVDLIRPVLDTGPGELMASLGLGIGGASAAVRSVLPDLLDRGRGSLLFTTGSAGLHPDPERAASAVTTTATTTYVALLRRALDGTGVRVGHTVIVGPVDRERDDAHHPDRVAADLWAHHRGRADAFPSVLRLRT
ncbi:SDR family NAD(P)-dependent oxidoreductase [Nocardioides sp.]|uniref:SDR family NAD(P)-dependent oxidoreductase n=1 Tax=Nocardioides sp. TaxID=35761 RepID=UPI002ED7CCF0